jgi:hypothetical protein
VGKRRDIGDCLALDRSSLRSQTRGRELRLAPRVTILRCHVYIPYPHWGTTNELMLVGIIMTLPHNKRRKLIAIIFALTFINYLRSTSNLTRQITVIIDNSTKNEQITYLSPTLSSSYNIRNNSSLSSTIIVPNNPRIYFIHVGKAGGTTIVTALRLKEIAGNSSVHHGILCKDKRGISYCYNQSSASDDISQLTQHILGYFHLKGGGQNRKYRKGRTWLLKKSNMFLFNVRSPIERLISAFNYHQHCPYPHLVSRGCGQNSICKRCFDAQDFNTMIETTSQKHVTIATSEDCSIIGMDALLGRFNSCGNHFQFNYEHYWKYAIGQRPNHSVAVVRMEHMWDDISQLDQLLGGTGDFGTVQGTKITHRKISNKTTLSGTDGGSNSTRISDTNRIFLCCLIAREINIYQQLILKAWNLHANQKRDSLTDMFNRCLIKPSENNASWEHPFSWKAFQQGATCQKSLGLLVLSQAELATFGFDNSTLPLLFR